MPTHPWFGPAQLEMFENDSAYQADDKDEPKEPNPETGYLTCKVCLAINHYEFPKKDYICRGCIVFKEWLTKK
jgi:hypothetical protein